MKKKLLLLCLILFGTLSICAETWTPVGQVQWTEGALSGFGSLFYKTWSVLVERSDSRPQVFRLQPYASNPFSSNGSNSKSDNVYVYLHTENPDQVYIEYYIYYYSSYSYYHVWQRCPENSFDSRYYGKISNNTTIEFPIGSFVVDWSETSSKKTEPSSYARYSKYVHKIVFPEGILDYTPPTETWVNVGKGQWEDPVWIKNGNPVVETVDFERNVQNPNVYRIKPYTDGEYINIHTENLSKVYITPYSHANSAGNGLTITQRCTENGVNNESYYGTMKDNIITIPGNYFRYNQEGSTSYSYGSSDRQCVITFPEGYNEPIEGEKGIFMGIMSFSDHLDNLPISVLNEDTEPTFIDFVNKMEMANATLLYYAVDQAITTLSNYVYPNNLSNAMIITFTDGLDQGSLAMAPEHLTSRNYAEYLSNRITSTKIQGLSLQTYTIGLKSGDVADDDLFMLNIESLSSKPENAHSVTDISGVQEELTKIYEELNKQISQRIISIKVPMMSHGDTFRFTFDSTVDASKVDDSQIWIEGVFDITDLSLNNVIYHGLTSSSGSKVTAERDGVYIIFTFNDCRDENGEIFEIEKDAIDQWTYISSNNTWQHNIENDKDGKINIEDISTSAAIMFVLDSSSSLGDLFPVLKETANSFISRLAGGGDTNDISSVVVDNGDIDPSTPVTYYNLQGVRVAQPTKGLYIVNGKKVVIK